MNANRVNPKRIAIHEMSPFELWLFSVASVVAFDFPMSAMSRDYGDPRRFPKVDRISSAIYSLEVPVHERIQS